MTKIANYNWKHRLLEHLVLDIYPFHRCFKKKISSNVNYLYLSMTRQALSKATQTREVSVRLSFSYWTFKDDAFSTEVALKYGQSNDKVAAEQAMKIFNDHYAKTPSEPVSRVAASTTVSLNQKNKNQKKVESKFKANKTLNSGWKNDTGNYSAIMNYNLEGDKKKKTSIKGK